MSTTTSTAPLTGVRAESYRLLYRCVHERDACLERLGGCQSEGRQLDPLLAVGAALPVAPPPPMPDAGLSVPVWLAILAGAALVGAGVALDRLLPHE